MVFWVTDNHWELFLVILHVLTPTAKQLKMTRELLDHVGLLLEKKVDILKILKTPHTSGFISLEAPYHKLEIEECGGVVIAATVVLLLV